MVIARNLSRNAADCLVGVTAAMVSSITDSKRYESGLMMVMVVVVMVELRKA
jgi:hypothetical protein